MQVLNIENGHRNEITNIEKVFGHPIEESQLEFVGDIINVEDIYSRSLTESTVDLWMEFNHRHLIGQVEGLDCIERNFKHFAERYFSL